MFMDIKIMIILIYIHILKMDVNIQTNILIKMQYTHVNAPAIHDINNYLHNFNVTGKGKVTSRKGKIILKKYNQGGGGIEKIELDRHNTKLCVNNI